MYAVHLNWLYTNIIVNMLLFYLAGKLKGMEKIALWNQNIVNYFWHCS